MSLSLVSNDGLLCKLGIDANVNYVYYGITGKLSLPRGGTHDAPDH